MLMTSTWMFAIWKEGDILVDEHPMARVMAKHHVVLEVFNVSYPSSITNQTTDFRTYRTFSGICFRTTLSLARGLQKKPWVRSVGCW